MIRPVRGRVRGLLETIKAGHGRARVLAVLDSRALVRALWLASAVRLDVLPWLRRAKPIEAIARHTGATRVDRLRAWLEIGVELRELAVRSDRFVVRGRRARALAEGDVLLTAHYRSMLDYQSGPYDRLRDLLRNDAEGGRTDLTDHASVIAQVSLAATGFVRPYLREVVAERRPRRVLDVGCGTGVYLEELLKVDGGLEADGIDLSADVIGMARARLRAAGVEGRARLHVGDFRALKLTANGPFDLVTLLNNIYYFDASERVNLYGHIGSQLSEAGELVIVTMVTPGSVASAHLHFMLTCQAGHASLPRQGDIERGLQKAGFVVVDATRLVPTEPLVGIRARRRPDLAGRGRGATPTL